MREIYTLAGDHINGILNEAKTTSVRLREDVFFMFNGIKCIVNKETNIINLRRDKDNAYLMDWKEVGPNCVNEYDEETQREINSRRKTQEEKYNAEREKYDIKCKKEKEDLEEKVKDVEFEIRNQKLFDEYVEKNQSNLGKCIIEYATSWAKLMQVEIANGNDLKDIWYDLSFKLNYLGVTGAMHVMSVQFLSSVWVFGEYLRQLHNERYNVEGEGVANPAIITLGEKDENC